MVIVLIGVLAVFATPMFSNAEFNARGFHDETLAYLRYGQKTAIAQRRTVCVAFTADSATLTIAGAANTAACDTPLIGPRGETPATLTARAGVTYITFPAAGFTFNPLGQPTAAQALQVASGGTAISLGITVEPGTGYVHD